VKHHPFLYHLCNCIHTVSTGTIGPYFRVDRAVKGFRTFGQYFFNDINVCPAPDSIAEIRPMSSSRSQTERKPARSCIFDDKEDREGSLHRALSLWCQGIPPYNAHYIWPPKNTNCLMITNFDRRVNYFWANLYCADGDLMHPTSSRFCLQPFCVDLNLTCRKPLDFLIHLQGTDARDWPWLWVG